MVFRCDSRCSARMLATSVSNAPRGSPRGGWLWPAKKAGRRAPFRPPPADAMQEKHELAITQDRERKARRRPDEDRLHYSALAPEMRTARARAALSFLIYAANSSGELPTTS